MNSMGKIAGIIWKYIEKIAYFVLKWIFRIAGKDLTDEKFSAFMQFVRFGIVGVSNTVISYIIYVVSLWVLNKVQIFADYNYVVAQVIVFILSVLWSFYWNNKMVFVETGEHKRNWVKALAKTYVSYSFTGLFLNSILLVLWVQVCHIPEMIAPLINLVISVPLNFFINKLWAFK